MRALVHGLRGKPSNRQHDEDFRKRVLKAYRQRYHDFGPTFACEKLAEDKLKVSPETLRRWLIAKDSGSVAASATRIAADDRDETASASWCRWMPRSTTGSKDAARRWS